MGVLAQPKIEYFFPKTFFQPLVEPIANSSLQLAYRYYLIFGHRTEQSSDRTPVTFLIKWLPQTAIICALRHSLIFIFLNNCAIKYLLQNVDNIKYACTEAEVIS